MNTRPNPYVGPRPFTARDPLPARKREVRELRSLLVAERVVLLHSPSGAGKTSLIEGQGGLKQALGEQYLARPTIRVNRPFSAATADARPSNRYTQSVVRSLEEAPGPAGPLPPSELITLGLAAYLERRKPELVLPGDAEVEGRRTRRELLIFDQFEEVLTADPRDDAGREEFFAELAEVLAERRRWVLFVIREDYLGALQPWIRRLPTQLDRRFRIDLLGADGAREAIRAPAAAQGVTVDDDALELLVRELRLVQVQGLDGKLEQGEGLWIEPVQLQVVCHRLWSRLAADAMTIARDAVHDFGDVDVALAEFYAGQVEAIARPPDAPASERAIREWIGARLISAQGVRTQVMKGEGHSDGLPNRVIEALEDMHVVRAEERRGVKWYELAHDRLVRPVLADNEAWFRAHLHSMQLQAALWTRQKEPASLLLDEEALQAAEAWAQRDGESLSADERRFLARSREALANERAVRDAQAQALAAERRRAEEREQAAARQRKLSRIVAVAGVIALIAAAVSFKWYLAAQEAAARARDAAWLTFAQARNESDPTRAAAGLQKVEALELAPNASQIFLRTLGRAIARNIVDTAAIGRPASVVALSADGQLMATGSKDGTIVLWRLDRVRFDVLGAHDGEIRALAFSSDGRWVASGARDGARVWRVDGAGESHPLKGHVHPVNAVVFNRDGSLVLTGSGDQRVMLCESASGECRAQNVTLDFPIRAVAFLDLHGAPLMALDRHGDRARWKPDTAIAAQPEREHQQTDVPSASIAADGRFVLVKRRTQESEALLFDDGGWRCTFPDDKVSSAAMSASEPLVAIGTEGGLVRVRSTDRGCDGHHFDLVGHTRPIVSIAFSGDGRWIATASADGDVRVWPSARISTLQPHDARVVAAAFDRSSRRVVTISSDTLRDYRVSDDGSSFTPVSESNGEKFRVVTLGPDGATVAVGTDDGKVLVYGPGRQPRVHVLPGGGKVLALGFDDSEQVLAAAARVDGVDIVAVGEPGERTLRSEPIAEAVTAAEFSTDAARIVLVSHEKIARVLDVRSQTPAISLCEHGGPVRAAAFHPDGQRVVTVADDRIARVWELTGIGVPRVSHMLEDYESEITSATFGVPETGVLAIITGNADGGLRSWELRQGDEPVLRYRIDGHVDGVTSLAVSPDRNWLMSASDDGSAAVWPLDSGIQRSLLTRVTTACVPAPELARFMGLGNASADEQFSLCEREHGRDPLMRLPDPLPKAVLDTTDLPYGDLGIPRDKHGRSGEEVEKLFDNDISTKYCCPPPPVAITYRHPCNAGREIKSYALVSANDAEVRDPAAWTLSGSNDGARWTPVDERSGIRFDGRYERKVFAVAHPGNFKQYRLEIHEARAGDEVQFAELELLLEIVASAL